MKLPSRLGLGFLAFLILAFSVSAQVFLDDHFDNGTTLKPQWLHKYAFQNGATDPWTYNRTGIMDINNSYYFNGSQTTSGKGSTFCLNYSNRLTTIDGSEKITLLISRTAWNPYPGHGQTKVILGSSTDCWAGTNQIYSEDIGGTLAEEYGPMESGFCGYSVTNMTQKFNMSFNRTHIRLLVNGVDKCAGIWKAFNSAIPDHSGLNLEILSYGNGNVPDPLFKWRATNITVYNESYPGYNVSGGGPPPVTSALSVYFLNNSNWLKKSVFQESENFRVYANFTLSNGSSLMAAKCNVTVPQGTLEYADSQQSFTVCSLGCNYSVYSFNRTGLVSNLAVADILHFSACHSTSITADLSVNLCGTLFTVPAASMPLCVNGFSSLFLNSSGCVGKPYSFYSFSNGLLQGHRVTALNLDRRYSKLLVYMPYNVTQKAYRSNRSLEYYRHGAYVLNVTCQSNGYKNSVSEGLTVVNKVPVINLNQLATYKNSYSLVNGLKVEYASGNWSWLASVVDDDLDLAVYTWRNSSQVLQRTVKRISGTVFTPGILFLRVGKVYNFSVFANDSFKNGTYRSITFTVNDTALPICNPLLNHTLLNNTLWQWNVSCSDDYFFSFNLSCDNGFHNSKADIDNTSFRFLNQSRFKDVDLVTCNYVYCDGHTAQLIDKLPVLTDVARSSFAVNGLELALSEPVKAIILTKQLDRYSFCYDFGESKAEQVAVTVPEGCYAALNSKWPGHLVCPDKRMWIDFVNEDVKASVVGNEVLLDLSEVKDRGRVCFNSVGKFNCVAGSQRFNITYPKVPKPNEFQSTGQALWFFFLSSLWLVFLFGTIVLKGPHGKHMLILNFAQLGLAVFLAADLVNKFALQFLAALIFSVSITFFVGMIFYEVKLSR